MPSIWKIISNLVLVIIFIILSVFSLVEYRSDSLDINAAEDKLPLAKSSFSGLSYVISYLEQMPMIRLLPAATKSLEYENQTLVNIDKDNVDSLINKSNIKEEIPLLKSKAKGRFSEIINFENFKKRLVEQLSKNWFRS